MEHNTSKRYESLDILRGLCALSIMLYHYFSWTLGQFQADNIFGRLGIYGVSLFYILSGLTMYLVYFNKFSFSYSFCKDFYLKRFFRIFPLMWLIIILNYSVFGTENSWLQQMEIAFGLFSVLNWDASTPLGMWSIGNELSFYLMLPFIFLIFKKGKIYTIGISLIFFLLYVYFAYYKYNPIEEDVFEVRNYKNPLNQGFLFLGGILIGYLFKNIELKQKYAMMIAIISVLLFCFIPAHGLRREIYIGNYRMLFTFISFFIAFGFFKLNIEKLNAFVKNKLIWLGEISYSLYLIHGLVWAIIVLTGIKIRYVLPISFLVTFIASYFVYKFLESPARNLGYKLLKKN